MDVNAIESWLKPEEQLGLNNCDREPLHIPGSVQRHGALCALDGQGHIRMRSENLEAYFGPGFEEGALVSQIAALDCGHGERHAVEAVVCGRATAVLMHRLNSLRVVEFEPVAPDVDLSGLIGTINRTSDQLAARGELQRAFELAVKAMRELTGFDRVFAYLFDAEGHGEVVASTASQGLEDLLNLRFPATDIPKQARRLYTVELTRQIVDVESEPVAITPAIAPMTGRPLNMMFCQLRTVSPIHIQYLKNMGVAASFSVSVVVGGELRALLACHHMTARQLDFRRRQACELLGRLIAQHFASREDSRRRQARSRQLAAQVELLCELGERNELDVRSKAWERAFEFVEANSLVIKIGEQQRVYGEEIEPGSRLLEVGDRLTRERPAQVSATTNLSEFEPTSSGGALLAVPLEGAGWLGWYREPEDQQVTWAGNPEHDATKTLTPRASFEAWQQHIKGFGKAWSQEDLEMAEVLRRGLHARFHKGSDLAQSSFERAMAQLREYVMYLEENAQALHRVNDDLRQFAYAASHDLRAPLRTVRSFLPLIRRELGEGAGRDELFGWLNHVEHAADTLYRLQEGLWAFSRVNRVVSHEEIALDVLFERVISGLAADLKGASITLGELPTIRGVESQVEMLCRNLLENASKYRSPERGLKIVVDAYKARGEWVITVSDNGLGFPPSCTERVFDLFTRVHPDVSQGDGLGLALCRRIAHHHNGWIRASSEPGMGSTFEVCLRSPQGAE